MTNLEELKRLCRASLDAQKIENAGNRALRAEADKLAPIDPRAVILSLIERLERAEAKRDAAHQRGMEEAAKVAENHRAKSDEVFDGVINRGRKGERNLELAAATAAGMSHEARHIALAIREKAKSGKQET